MGVYRSIAPVFLVADVGGTARWYREVLGASAEVSPPSEPDFAILGLGDVEVMLQGARGYVKPDDGSLRRSGVWDAYVRVERGIDALHARLAARTAVSPLERRPYGCVEFSVRDCNGDVLVFSEG
jgi:hypothetical protein